MKKYLRFFMLVSIFVVIFSTVAFAKLREVTEVTIYHIDSPYEQSRTLDTKADIGDSFGYRITNVAWQSPSVSLSGYYEVTVTLVADKEYTFAETVKATVNEKSASKVVYDEKEEELNVTYIFEEESNNKTSISSDTARFSITSYCNENYGKIMPASVRILERDDQTIKIVPNEGYKIKDVKVDGESVGAVSEYTFKKVEKNHRINAYFEKVSGEESSSKTEENVSKPAEPKPTVTKSNEITEKPSTNVEKVDATPIFDFFMKLIQFFALSK